MENLQRLQDSESVIKHSDKTLEMFKQIKIDGRWENIGWSRINSYSVQNMIYKRFKTSMGEYNEYLYSVENRLNGKTIEIRYKL